jgi:pyrroloquinoline quinone biosynthesis protein B
VAAWRDPASARRAACAALVDPEEGAGWMVDATPDFRAQQWSLVESALAGRRCALAGILLTHAHMGHYTGLMHLGREGMGSRELPIHCLPRLAGFLENNGPWDQLVRLRNVVLHRVSDGETIRLSGRLQAMAVTVPHRDEYSETAGYRVEGPRRSALYVPDIDGWDAALTAGISIEALLASVDGAYLDGTFFDERELPGVRREQIPHPTIAESLARFAPLPAEERAKIRFIHLNHSNPAVDPGSPERRAVEEAGMAVAEEGEVFEL